MRIFLFVLVISASGFADQPPGSECAFALVSLSHHDIFDVKDKFQLSKAARFTGFKWVTPIVEEDGRTGGLLVYVEPGTDLSQRTTTFEGLPVNYKEKEGSIGRVAEALPAPADKGRAYMVLPLRTQHWIANQVEALLINQKIPFSHLELRPTHGGLVALLVHFDSPEEFYSKGATYAAEFLVPMSRILPIVLLSEDDELFLEL